MGNFLQPLPAGDKGSEEGKGGGQDKDEPQAEADAEEKAVADPKPTTKKL